MTHALAHPTEALASHPANDNDRGPGDTEGDRWRFLIEGWKPVSMPLAVYAAKERLKGVGVDDFVRRFIRVAVASGWECMQPGGQFAHLARSLQAPRSKPAKPAKPAT